MCAFKCLENGVKQYMQLQCSANSLTRVLLMHVMKVFADADDNSNADADAEANNDSNADSALVTVTTTSI